MADEPKPNNSPVRCWVRYTDQDVNKPPPAGGFVQSLSAIHAVFFNGLIRGATTAEYFGGFADLANVPTVWRPTNEYETYRSYERPQRRNADGNITA